MGVVRNVATRTLGLPSAKTVSRIFKNAEKVALSSPWTRTVSRSVLRIGKGRQN